MSDHHGGMAVPDPPDGPTGGPADGATVEPTDVVVTTAAEPPAVPVAERAAVPVAEPAAGAACASEEAAGPVAAEQERATVEPPPDGTSPGPSQPGPVGAAAELSEATVPAAAPSAVAPPTTTEPAARPTRVIALANQKGGVGKTTTTVNLGAALAEQDHRVLIVDLDPQGNATTGLGINYRMLEHTMYDVLLSGVPLDDCIEPTEVKGLFVAPASLDLAGAEVELVPAFSREGKLKRALDEVVDDYDFVLIDCPPSLGLLTVNGLVAATEVMVPIQCEYYALEGLAQLTRNVDLVRENLNPALRIGGIVLVMYDSRTKLGEQVVQEVRDHFGSLVCRNMIPRNVKLSEAPSFGQPITIYDPSSRGAVAYRELAREVSRGA